MTKTNNTIIILHDDSNLKCIDNISKYINENINKDIKINIQKIQFSSDSIKVSDLEKSEKADVLIVAGQWNKTTKDILNDVSYYCICPMLYLPIVLEKEEKSSTTVHAITNIVDIMNHDLQAPFGIMAINNPMNTSITALSILSFKDENIFDYIENKQTIS